MTTSETPARNHALAPLRGRDPNEPHRVSSPLELLFDLTFAAAFATGGASFAHHLAAGHIGAATLGFGMSTFAIVWAWINFSWFASAYDNDDWAYRLMSMVVMVGVVILSLGLPTMYASIVEGDHFANQTMVLGYVVMRVALITGWWRARRDDPARRDTITIYLVALVIAQLGWVIVALAPLPLAPAVGVSLGLFALEMAGPALAERKGGTPWHPIHIAERYGLLVIITLGEGVIGTIAALSAAVSEHNWTAETVMVVIAGIGLTLGLWWIYFIWDAGEILDHYRERSFAFGYLHMPLFASIAAVGAGLHVAGYWMEGEAHLPAWGVVGSIALPVGLYVAFVFAIYYALHRGGTGENRAFHTLLFVLTLVVIASGVALAALGVSLGICLLVVMLGPVVTVVGSEVLGIQHMSADRARLLANSPKGRASE